MALESNSPLVCIVVRMFVVWCRRSGLGCLAVAAVQDVNVLAKRAAVTVVAVVRRSIGYSDILCGLFGEARGGGGGRFDGKGHFFVFSSTWINTKVA